MQIQVKTLTGRKQNFDFEPKQVCVYLLRQCALKSPFALLRLLKYRKSGSRFPSLRPGQACAFLSSLFLLTLSIFFSHSTLYLI